MVKSQLTLEETKDMFIYVSKKIIESKDVLTKADQAIGDGDHGVGMARGFEAVLKKLDEQSFSSIGDLLSKIGMSLLTSIGGAAGAIFGTLFRGASKNLKEKVIFDAWTFSQLLLDGLEAVKERGKAKIGDKTMIDALEPSAIRVKELTSKSLNEVLSVATEEAKLGMEKTKEMIATIGKAKTLGVRSLGHPDPGAISTYLIIKYMLEFVIKTEI